LGWYCLFAGISDAMTCRVTLLRIWRTLTFEKGKSSAENKRYSRVSAFKKDVNEGAEINPGIKTQTSDEGNILISKRKGLDI
jgi:hypothetical protein